MELVQKHAQRMKGAALRVALAFDIVAGGGEINPENLNPSDKACQWCRAKAHCKAFERFATAQVAQDFASTLDSPFDSPDAVELAASGQRPAHTPQRRLGTAYASLPVLEQWIAAVRAEVDRQVRAGMAVDGPDGLPLKLVSGGYGHRKWSDPARAEALLVGLLPPDKAYQPREIITAPQAAKLLDKKKTAALWAQLETEITKPQKPPIVVLGSDPRPVYSGAATAAEFQDLSAAD